MLVGGMVLLRDIPLAGPDRPRSVTVPHHARCRWHHGNRRCGCATPPHKQALMEWGIYGSLPD